MSAVGNHKKKKLHDLDMVKQANSKSKQKALYYKKELVIRYD